MGLRCHPICATLAGMDTSTTPYISPVLEPETTMALMLRHVEDHEEAAYQCARVMMRSFMFDLNARDAFALMRSIITETTNSILDFEGRRWRAGSTSRCGG